jgi:chemotaxis protein CheD
MNHILLPGRPNIKKFDEGARYGIFAMDILMAKIMKLGGNRRSLLAKAFGGASVLPGISHGNGVGEKIVEFVRDFLENEHIDIIGHDFGGDQVRKVFFHTDTGDVFLKRSSPMTNSSVLADEIRQLQRIKEKMAEIGEAIIFNGYKK